ncbi:hypothetical protein BGX38DRAFT_1145962 [Terfezia claveryi]|nr:hypothetical protein BGX38DRAFT_1145962 [Terfezia claveryi]
MDRLRFLRNRIEKLAGKSKLTPVVSNLQIEADRLLATLGSCLTQQQKTSHLVQTSTQELSLLLQDVRIFNKTVAEMKSKLNTAEGTNAEQEREKEADLRRTIQDFARTVDKGLTSVMDQVDEVSTRIDQARLELEEVKVLNFTDLSCMWIQEILSSSPFNRHMIPHVNGAFSSKTFWKLPNEKSLATSIVKLDGGRLYWCHMALDNGIL